MARNGITSLTPRVLGHAQFGLAGPPGWHPRRAAAAGGPPVASPAAGRGSLPVLLLSAEDRPRLRQVRLLARQYPRPGRSAVRARAAGTLPAHLLQVAVRTTRGSIGHVRGNAPAPIHGLVPPCAHHGQGGSGGARFAQLSPWVRPGALSRRRGPGGRHGGAASPQPALFRTLCHGR